MLATSPLGFELVARPAGVEIGEFDAAKHFAPFPKRRLATGVQSVKNGADHLVFVEFRGSGFEPFGDVIDEIA
jgi:hypothetical protein